MTEAGSRDENRERSSPTLQVRNPVLGPVAHRCTETCTYCWNHVLEIAAVLDRLEGIHGLHDVPRLHQGLQLHSPARDVPWVRMNDLSSCLRRPRCVSIGHLLPASVVGPGGRVHVYADAAAAAAVQLNNRAQNRRRQQAPIVQLGYTRL
jgi:hypothetical protein